MTAVEAVTSGQPCGTYAAFQAHKRDGLRGDQIDAACHRAAADYISHWRARNGRTKNTLVPYKVLGELLEAAPPDLRTSVESVLGDVVVARAIALAATP